MALATEFVPLQLDRLRDTAHRMKDEGWRFIQTHAAYNEPNVDLYYSFMKDGNVVNYRIEGVTKEDPVPSITDIFLAAFVFENEARELFGVDMRDIAIDFQGGLYAPAETEPMRIISPEQKAQIEKARKAAAAKAAKAARASEGAASKADAQAAQSSWKLSDEKRAKLEEKLKEMDPAKAAKVRAALEAKEAAAAASAKEAPSAAAASSTAVPAAKAGEASGAAQSPSSAENAAVGEALAADAPGRDDELEAKPALLGEEKAKKVRAALAGKPANADATGADAPAGHAIDDAELEAKLALLDADKAEKVRAALARAASAVEGE